MELSIDYTNRQIGAFRVVSRIAAGGFSTIWKAIPIANGDVPGSEMTNAAIKIMRPDVAISRDNRNMFAHEWKIVRSFDHPKMLKYHQYGVYEGFPFLTMEYFAGQTLRKILIDNPDAIRPKTAVIVGHVAEALAYIHKLGLVHRDVKPENILVNEEGEIRLIDFSLAQTKWERTFNFFRKRDGTPSYMSPEQLARQRLTPQSDLYSLGVILFEMLSGRSLFVGKDAREVMRQHLWTAPPRLSHVNPVITTAVDKLVASLLAKSPDERPRDAYEVIRRITSTEFFLPA
ncbi:MAG: serine/threonine-protein kinase [Planctomycetota bacterium]